MSVQDLYPSSRTRCQWPHVGTTIALASAVLLGLLIRLSFVVGSDFPLNDGALFYTMVRDLQQAHYRLPLYTSYNGGRIPFAYPPMALYLAALLDDLTSLGLLDILRVLPLLVSTLTILAFYPLSKAMLPSRWAQISAVFVFAMLPMGFQWTIMGGGLTRAPGLLFSILTLYHVYLMYRRVDRRRIIAVTVFAACTVLSHPEAAWFTLLSALVLFLAYGRNRTGVLNSLAVGLGTLALTAPWWLTVLLRQGVSVLYPAGDSGFALGQGLLHLLFFEVSREGLFPVLALLAFLGLIVTLAARSYVLPGWLLATYLLLSRAPDQKAVLPLALLAGIGMHQVLLPLLQGQPLSATPYAADGPHSESALLRGRLPKLILLLLLVQSAMSGLLTYRPMLSGLSPEEREAMQWVSQNTPASGSFLVLTADTFFGADRSSEWFPVLAQRTSVATVQGYEWLPGFSQRIERYESAQLCVHEGLDCLEHWVEETGVVFGYVYVTKRQSLPDEFPSSIDYCRGLRNALQADPR
ncbi:MAG: hypothetical protein FJ026_03860, partial [Chloroflexi bacterium]|nr:hypothetical protein [Chloroflexota bacterium]